MKTRQLDWISYMFLFRTLADKKNTRTRTPHLAKIQEGTCKQEKELISFDGLSSQVTNSMWNVYLEELT